jgi:hypothetical protein
MSQPTMLSSFVTRQDSVDAGAGAFGHEVVAPGRDMLPFLGDMTCLLDEMREHLTGQRYAQSVDRVFAAVPFTDLVGSTTEVVRMGDER